MATRLVELLIFPSPLLIALASLFRRSSRRRIEDVRTLLVFVIFALFAGALQAVLIRDCVVTYDKALLAADNALKFPTLSIWQWVRAHHPAFLVLGIVYVALPNVIALAWIVEQNPIMRSACVIAGIFCFVGYVLLPAVGPAHYNWANQSATSSPRNCLPSMHMTWALLIAMIVRDRRLKIVLWAYALLVAVATVAVGEHYLVDLVVAVPYSMAVFWAAQLSHNYFFRGASRIMSSSSS